MRIEIASVEDLSLNTSLSLCGYCRNMVKQYSTIHGDPHQHLNKCPTAKWINNNQKMFVSPARVDSCLLLLPQNGSGLDLSAARPDGHPALKGTFNLWPQASLLPLLSLESCPYCCHLLLQCCFISRINKILLTVVFFFLHTSSEVSQRSGEENGARRIWGHQSQ